MLLLTIKSVWRNLLRKKQNAFIIILSLSIAFTFSNILITFINHELSTDQFHRNKDHIYRMFSDDPFEPGKKIRFIQENVGQYLADHYAEIEDLCRVTALNTSEKNTLEVDDISIPDQLVLVVDSSFFEMFNFQLSEGTTDAPIGPEGIVLKRALAKSLLGAPPYVGKTLELINGKEVRQMRVTAILDNFEENTQFNFDAIISSTKAFGGSIFITLGENADPNDLLKKINADQEVPSLVGPGKSQYELEPFVETYFNAYNVQPYDRYRNKNIILICWVVVLLLSFTASFNFINLYVVGLLTRQKEIGLKRIFGASRFATMVSIGIEVSLFIGISMILSLALTYYLIPLFNSALNASLNFSYFTYLRVMALIIGAVFILGVFITIYLTIYTWRFSTLRLINDKIGSKVKASKFLFAIQFFVSVGLIIGSMVIVKQMLFIQNKPLGFNRHLMQLQVSEQDQRPKLKVLKNNLLQLNQIKNASLSSGNPISGNAIVRFDLENGEFYAPFLIAGDEDFIKTMGLEIVEGTNINPQNQNGMLVNETLVNYFDMKDPIGEQIPGSDLQIVGVVKDFNCRSLKQEIPPFIIGQDSNLRFLLIDIAGIPKEEVISLVSTEWEKVFPNEPFEYKLIEDELMARHKEDIAFFKMVISFTIASLIISCFGLYGIASFTTSRRTHEIGIRKVLGASFSNIILLIWKDYVKLIVISFILAVPVANYFLREWLNEFAYKINLTWWLYTIPGAIILLIALLTISGQSIKAANANPVDSIKDE